MASAISLRLSRPALVVLSIVDSVRVTRRLNDFCANGIPQMGSVGTQAAAPPPSPGQYERAFGGVSLIERAFEVQSAGRFGCSRVCRRYSAHGSPLGSG